MNPRVVTVSATANYSLKIQFSNGEFGIYDCNHLLDFGVFKELQDISYFRQVKVLDGTVAWPNEQDICPDTLYIDSIKHDHHYFFSRSHAPRWDAKAPRCGE
jgi:hypothetical protein